ncbi:MAG: S8 family peptidase [Gammaproteobacteria bacterium]|nr:S8 family peptidase [Gammaproteobacteria bacterium]
MKKSLISLAVLTATGLSASAGVAGDLGKNLQNSRFVIEYKPGARDAVIEAVANAGATIKADLVNYESIAIEINSLDSISGLRKNSNIASIEADAIRSFGPVGAKELASHTDDPIANLNPQYSYGIHMVQGDELYMAAADSGVKVCVMDTGYDIGHPDLPFANVDGTNDPGAGYWGDYFNHYHGTHVAGTIAAKGDNGIGVVGVIANAEDSVPLFIAKVFDNDGGFAYSSGIVGALDACIEAGANVINMSLGGSLESKLEKRAFERARKNGVLSIAAAGNDGNSTHSYPASYDSVMSVGAVDINKDIADFSQNTSQVEISAPGVQILSTDTRAEWGGNEDIAYWVLSGTSMATPHVSGVAALVWSHYPQCSNYDIRTALKNSAEDLGESGNDYAYGAGLVQAKAAYDYLAANGCSGNSCKGKECDPAK